MKLKDLFRKKQYYALYWKYEMFIDDPTFNIIICFVNEKTDEIHLFKSYSYHKHIGFFSNEARIDERISEITINNKQIISKKYLEPRYKKAKILDEINKEYMSLFSPVTIAKLRMEYNSLCNQK